MANIEALTVESSIQTHEHRVIASDGEIRWQRWTNRALFDTRGKVVVYQSTGEDISEHKLAVDALKQERDIFIGGPVVVFQWAAAENWPVAYVSPNVSQFGYTANELTIGRVPHTKLVHPDDLDRVTREVEEYGQSGAASYEQEYRIVCAGGETRWIYDFTVVHRNDQDEVTCHNGYILDITEQKQADEALRESEEKFRSVFEDSGVVMVLVDSEGRYIQVNKAMTEVFGYSQEELLSMGSRDITYPGDLIPSSDVARRLWTGESNGFTTEKRYVHKDGNLVWGHITVSPIRDSSGKTKYTLGQLQDITEHKRAEEALHERERQLSRIYDSVGVVLFYVAVEPHDCFRFLSINQLFLDITGLANEQIVGKRIEEVIPEPSVWMVKDNYKRAIKLKRIVRWEETTEYPAGAKIGEVSIAPIFDDKGICTHLVGTVHDITGRKRAEVERVELEAQLVQSRKMESIGRLAGGVAHDFNNILTGINGYTEMLIDSLVPGDPVLADMKEIKLAGERGTELTNQLLAFSRKQVITPKVVRPNEILDQSLRMLHRIVGEDIELVFAPAQRLGRIKVGPAQLDQIVVNLVVNARDAMPEGGKLIIETQNVMLDEEFCSSHVGSEPGDYVMMAVSDSGSGMDEETKTHIFEPFFSTKEREQGTGLGLSTVYGIVKQNNGYISVYTEPNEGTSFKLYFPRVSEKADKLTGDKYATFPTGSETILLVEDDEMVRGLAKRILQRQGYRVIETNDGDEAYLQSRKHAGEIHLLLTDVIMPGMNGKQLYEELARTRPNLKALLMSGYTENVIIHHGVLDEGTAFIQKPFSIESLAIAVRSVLDN